MSRDSRRDWRGHGCFTIPLSMAHFVKEGERYRLDTLREMVKEVNRTQLLPTEILSDEVFRAQQGYADLIPVVASQEESL